MPKPFKVNSLASKVLVLFGLLVLSTIPRMYVDGIIADRQLYEREATESVVSGWAAEHEIGEIEMDVPYHRFEINETTKRRQRIDFTATFKPERLVVDYKDQIEFRSRGIFRIPIYKANVTIEGEVVLPKDLDPQLSDEFVTSNVQKLRFQLPHASAISDFQLTVGDQPATAERVDGGLELELTQQTLQPGESLKFELRLRMNGYQSFKIGTSAANLEVKMASAWSHPSFKGQLPIDQKIGDKGFTARWKLIQSQKSQGISVQYLEPVNIYAQANRALKYGFLITLLCLSVLFIMETLARLKIHAMQYLLMTLPLSCFYVLLLALAEHIGFQTAYAIASFSVVALIYIYFTGIGASRKQSVALGAILTVVYGLTLTMLSSEDFALLIGAITLFICLASFMLMTRKVDWSAGLAPKGESDEFPQSATR